MSKISELLKGSKVKIIVFLGIMGIALIFLSEFKGDNSKSQSVTENIQDTAYENYGEDMEQKLREILQNIDGVGRAEVMVTVGCTEEYIYASEEKVKNGEKDYSSENQYVLIGSGSRKEALLKKVVSPQISGVVIICEGGDSNIVKEKVYSSVSAACDISSNRIYVTKLK